MKIGIITHNFPASERDRQNAGIFVFDLAKDLSKQAEVVVLTPGSEEGIKVIAGIKTHSFKFADKLGNLKIYKPGHLVKFGNFFIQGRKALKKFVEENKDLDFIISMWAFPSGFFAYNAYRSKKIPYAIYALGSDIYFYAKKPMLKKLITKYLKEAKFLIADSPDLSKEVKRLSGKKTLFLPSASAIQLNKEIVKIPNSKITFTYLGRMEMVKGIDIFMDALARIRNYEGKFEVNIIGDGSLLEVLKNKFKDYVGIKFWANINDFNKITKILKKSDWLVIPSRSDSIPLVFSEGMKLSLPVIVSDLPDLKYLVNKYRVGKMFNKESTTGLAKILSLIIQGKIRRMDFIRNTSKAAEIFDLKKSSVKLIDLIKENL